MKRLALVVGSFVLALALAAPPASANHAWNGYHWARTANPFEIKLGDNVDSGWDSHLSTAAGDWETGSAVLDTAVVAGSVSDPTTCTPPLGRVEVCNAAYGQNGWLGLARIWIKSDGSGHIKKGQVLLNDTYFSMDAYDDPDARLHVMCQEIGHTFGLNHQHPRKARSCMNDRFGLFDPAYSHPNQHDFDQLAAIYAHLDSSSTVGATTRGERVRVRTTRTGTLVVTFITRA